MQLPSTLLFLTTILAAARALPSIAAPKTAARKVKLGETAYYPGVLANVQGWINPLCPASETASYTHKVDQGYCYVLPKVEFHSYKLWQPVAPSAPGWLCTFALYFNTKCSSYEFTFDRLPKAEKDFECNEGLKDEFGDTPQGDFNGFRSFRLDCVCNDAKGCVVPAH